jgi:hypothetical protein
VINIITFRPGYDPAVVRWTSPLLGLVRFSPT